ncbi:unnamed protein product, partial [Discosporangium mesarthrocarpum]
KLRLLPVWETLSGKRVPVERGRQFSLEEGGEVEGLPLPPGAADRLLAPREELRDLHRDLGVQSVSHSGVVARFVIPELGSVAEGDRRALLGHIKTNWARLKEDQDLVNALKEVAFIPVKGVPTKASHLFDPRNDLLKEIFCDEPDAFPLGEFAEEGWLDVLVDVGLRATVDRDTFLECAEKVQSQRCEPLAPDVEARACLLAGHLEELAWDGDFYNREFLTRLANTYFVPVDLPPPPPVDPSLPTSSPPPPPSSSAPSSMGGVAGAGAAGGSQVRGRNFGGKSALVRYADAAVPKDRFLVFTTMAVQREGMLPPQLMWSKLKIKTPPPIEIVLRHLRLLTQRHSQLDRWEYPDSPTKVFGSLYEFLDENWSKLSPNVRQGLKEMPLVPVGARLVKAGRLFFRLKENLSPFMFEVPRAFGAFDCLFRHLGTTQTPTARDYATFLKELAGECGSQALNPNELSAVLKVLHLLAAAAEDSGVDQAMSSDIFVPDDSSELVPLGLCLHNDCPWLSGRVDPSRLRALHPMVPVSDCRKLHIPSVSEVVREELELGFDPEPFLGDEDLQKQLSATLSSPELALAVTVLVHRWALTDTSSAHATPAAATTAGGFETHEARSQAAAAHLSEFRVMFVSRLRCRFLRILPGELGGEEDITAADGAEGSVFSVRE